MTLRAIPNASEVEYEATFLKGYQMTRTFMLALLILVSAPFLRADYDPLLTVKAKPEHSDLMIQDAKRSREIPIRVYLPENKTAALVVLFSHGLGGNREGSAFLGKHWAKRGYISVFLQHPGSDDGVWKDLPVAERMTALKQAARCMPSGRTLCCWTS